MSVKRPDEPMNPLGRSKAVIEIEIKAGRYLPNFLGAIVVEGYRRPPIAINVKLIIRGIQGAEERASFAERPSRIEIAPRFN